MLCNAQRGLMVSMGEQLFQRDQSLSTPALMLKPFPCPEAASMSTAMWQLPALPSIKAAGSWAVLTSSAHRRGQAARVNAHEPVQPVQLVFSKSLSDPKRNDTV